MLLKKEGFPEEGDLVLCTVTHVHFHSVFVTLDEYGKSAMIHISEIAPGRIRNIRDYVVEGKKVVCVVLRVNNEKGHVDLSLRRVNEMQKRAKTDKIKQEQKAEKIIELVAKSLIVNVQELYNEIHSKVSKKYDYLSDFFQDVALGNAKLDKAGIKKEYCETLQEAIKQRIKENKVKISGDLLLTTYTENGVQIIKEALKKASAGRKDVTIRYEGGGKYDISVESTSYKEAENSIDEITKIAIDYVKENDGEGKFIRAE